MAKRSRHRNGGEEHADNEIEAGALGLALLAPIAGATGAAPVCEAGKGYVVADTAQQVNEEFLAKIKAAGIGTVIRYYDWVEETLPGKTLTVRELSLIAEADMAVAVIFQHNNDCLCTGGGGDKILRL